MGNPAIGKLIGSNIFHPFGIKGSHIKIKGGGHAENLCIACPAKPFVTLRTVGGNIQKIPFLSPLNILLKLVDQRIRT